MSRLKKDERNVPDSIAVAKRSVVMEGMVNVR